MLRCLFVCAIGLASVPALAQPLPGNVASGRQIAVTICSSCHHVAGTRPPRPGDPAGFEAIANLPSTTALSLNVFLRSTHADMPDLILKPAEANDVIAYLLSLKR